MNHYTYEITKISIQKHYIGTRSSKIEPEQDIGYIYFSSSTDKEFMQDQKTNPSDYIYNVLSKFNTREEAIQHEIDLHKEFNVGVNENYFNKVRQTSTGFNSGGIPKNTAHKQLISDSNKRTKNSDEWKNSVGKITRSKLVIATKKLWENREYREKQINSHKGKCTGLMHSTNKPIGIYNEFGEHIFTVLYDIVGSLDLLGYPGKQFQSTLYRGTKLYSSNRECDIGKYKNSKYYYLKGWYAKHLKS